MFIVEFFDFLVSYSQDVLIVAFLVAIISACIDKFLTIKQKLYIKMLTPFFLGIMLFFLLNVFKGNVEFNAKVISAGVMSGSLSSVIFAFFDRLITGKEITTDPIILSVSKLLDGFVNKELITTVAKNIKEVFSSFNVEKEIKSEITKIISLNKIETVTEEEVSFLTDVCYQTVKGLSL